MSINTVQRYLLAGLLAPLSLFSQGISVEARQQIAEILSIKRTFTPEMNKMDSDTAFGLLKSAGKLPPWLASIVATDASGFVRVEIKGQPGEALRQAIANAGGRIESASPNNDVLVAVIPYGNLSQIAARTDVRAMAAPAQATTNGNLRSRMPAFIGSVTSQGIVSHREKDLLAQLGYTGAGVKVGVLSDSASAARVTALIATGDLPADTVVLPGQGGAGTDEGTAMMELVADMAPGAQIYFATAFSGVNSFAANIIELANAGCKVIVDDVSYFNEGVFQDGPIAQAVNTVTGMGVVYLSSAGNSGNLTQATSGTWEGDFVNGGAVSGPLADLGETGFFHSFSGQNYNALTAVSSNTLMLKWSDPLGGSSNDYDLFVFNSTGTALKRFGAAVQNGTQDPVELTGGSASVAVGDRVVVVLFSGNARAMNLSANRGRLQFSTSGATYGHNAAVNTVTVAAVNWNAAKTGTKPFVGGATNRNENFSSDGPRRIFYHPNGTPITAGNFLFATNGGSTVIKPDVAAADGTFTATPGFKPFFGTSASAPHVAGIAALVLQACPSYTPAQVKAALRNSALDNMAPGIDRDSGYGIAMALQAVRYCIAHPSPSL